MGITLSGKVNAEFNALCPTPRDCGTWVSYAAQTQNITECIMASKDIRCNQPEDQAMYEGLLTRSTFAALTFLGNSARDEKGELTEVASFVMFGNFLQELKTTEIYSCGCDIE